MSALIFDMDGVVANTEPAHHRSWRMLADEEGVPFDHATALALRGRTREQSLELLLAGRVLPEAERSDWLARKQRMFLADLAAMGRDDVLPGVLPLLAEARAAGVPCAIASSSRNARGVIERLGLTGHFAVIADGASVARPKPAPDVFLHAAALLGMPPDRCVVIEDSRAGVDAGVAGGFAVLSVGEHPLAAHHVRTLEGMALADLLGLLPDAAKRHQTRIAAVETPGHAVACLSGDSGAL